MPHLDFLIVNDFEIGALAGVATRRADGSTDVAAVGRAIGEALERGAIPGRRPFPKPVAGGRDGTRVALAPVATAANAVVGVDGAGDAFAAGLIYGLHDHGQLRTACGSPTPRRRLRCARSRPPKASRRLPTASRSPPNGVCGRIRKAETSVYSTGEHRPHRQATAAPPHRGRELHHQPRQLRRLSGTGSLEYRAKHALARGVDALAHQLACLVTIARRCAGRRRSRSASLGPGLQVGELTADGRLVAVHAGGDRRRRPGRNARCRSAAETKPVQPDAGRRDQRLVAVRPFITRMISSSAI